MPKISVINIKVDSSVVQDLIDVLSRAYAYDPKLPDGTDNPETRGEFVKRTIFENVRADYVSQKRRDMEARVTLDAEVL